METKDKMETLNKYRKMGRHRRSDYERKEKVLPQNGPSWWTL
jgi:hypothetical protein